MKLTLFFTINLSIILICCSSNSSQKSYKKDKENITVKLKDDFGYLRKSDGLSILKQLELSSKKNEGWNSIKQNDTIGKYFKSKETGNYILCIIDVQNKFDFETHLLIELKKQGKTSFSVVAKERYVHGNYSCCWNNYYDGFNRIGNYFTFDCCGTGSSFCGSNTYFFKTLNPQDSSMYIPDNYWSADDSEAMQLTSKKELNKDSLTYHYKIDYLEKNTEDEFIFKNSDTFSIIYLLKNNTFICNDKKLESLQF